MANRGIWTDIHGVPTQIAIGAQDLQDKFDLVPPETDPVYMNDKPSLALKSELTDNDLSELAYNIATRILSIIKNNGDDLSVIIPQASDTNDGLMTFSDRKSLVGLIGDVTSLKLGGVWRAEYATYADLISDYPGLDVSGTNWFVNDYVEVLSDETPTNALHVTNAPTIYRVTVSDSLKTLTYQRDFLTGSATNVAIATNDSLGVVKGSDVTEDGKTFMESDGTQSVIGWDNLKNSIQILVSDKANTVSPSLTGTPTAPTASATSNNSQIATTAFVKNTLKVQASNDWTPSTLSMGQWGGVY